MNSEIETAYLINVDQAHDAVIIHRQDCQWIRDGAQRMVAEEWHGPVPTVQEALDVAMEKGGEGYRVCPLCRP